MLKDYIMALFVLCLVVIDVVILGTYTLVEGLRGNLGVKLVPNTENPKEIVGVSERNNYCVAVLVYDTCMYTANSRDPPVLSVCV